MKPSLNPSLRLLNRQETHSRQKIVYSPHSVGVPQLVENLGLKFNLVGAF